MAPNEADRPRRRVPLFEEDRPLRVAVLFSGGASGFRYLATEHSDYGEVYEVVCGVASDPDCSGVDVLEAHDVPVEVRDIRAFYEERGADTGDMELRAEFDRGTREVLAEYDPDLVVLSGYMWILTDPVVSAFPVVNVHPADLTVREGGEREYVGADPVYDAVVAGEDRTYSTVHFVTTEVDEGPILVRSRPFEVHRELVDALRARGADRALGDYVGAHQEWMKWAGDGPALATALALVADGRVDRDGDEAWIDGERGFYDLGDGRVRSPGE